MKLLEEVVVALKHTTYLGAGMQRLHNVCSILHRVAKLYIRQREALSSRMYREPSDFPTTQPPQLGPADGNAPVQSFEWARIEESDGMDANAKELSGLFEEYLTGNANIFDLLDTDLV